MTWTNDKSDGQSAISDKQYVQIISMKSIYEFFLL